MRCITPLPLPHPSTVQGGFVGVCLEAQKITGDTIMMTVLLTEKGEDSSRDIWDIGSTGLSHWVNVAVSCREASKGDRREPAFFSHVSAAGTHKRGGAGCAREPVLLSPSHCVRFWTCRFQRLWNVWGQVSCRRMHPELREAACAIGVVGVSYRSWMEFPFRKPVVIICSNLLLSLWATCFCVVYLEAHWADWIKGNKYVNNELPMTHSPHSY